MTKVRINKFIADSGICSRRAADEHILHGEVFINGKPAKPGDKVETSKDKVIFRGKQVKTSVDEYEYWAVYKPVGYISTVQDEFGRKKVTDLVKSNKRLYPVGRLDEDSEGLMILTNDGEMTKILTHPSYQHRKQYLVEAKLLKNNSLEWLKRNLEHGISVSGKIMSAREVISIDKINDSKLIKINLILTTGYNRQIRRMCDKIGLEVVKLTRVGIANLSLQELKLKSGQAVRISKNKIL